VPVAIFVAAVMIYTAAAAQDLRQRRVSNLFCAGIALLGLARWAVLMQISPAAWAVAAAVLLFGLGALMFSRGWLGGGDVKLICASALLIGGGQTPAFLFLMSIIGSVLALIIVVQVKLGQLFGTAGGAAPDAENPSTVPYGVAVALAASFVIFLQIQRA